MGARDAVEACGRCAMSSAADLTSGRNPFAGEDVIEVEEAELRAVSRHVVALGRIKSRLNEWARAFTYGR